jgi:hypothetical protein
MVESLEMGAADSDQEAFRRSDEVGQAFGLLHGMSDGLGRLVYIDDDAALQAPAGPARASEDLQRVRFRVSLGQGGDDLGAADVKSYDDIRFGHFSFPA